MMYDPGVWSGIVHKFQSFTFGIQINLKKPAQFHSNMVIVLTVCIDSAWTQGCISMGLVKP